MEFISAALILGFISSFHCIGMCGPIAFSLGIDATNKFKFHTQNITYQFGRITTYTFMGLMFGIIGRGLNILVYQKYISITAGILLILMVLLPGKTSEIGNQMKFLNRFMIKLKIFLSKYIQRKDYFSRYTTGILNGLLPCGPVYVALTASIAAGNILNSALFMTFYGIGTLPFMFAAVVAGNLMSIKLRNKLNKIYPYMIILMGIIFIFRGLELGIPFLSPSSNALQLNAIKDCCTH